MVHGLRGYADRVLGAWQIATLFLYHSVVLAQHIGYIPIDKSVHRVNP